MDDKTGDLTYVLLKGHPWQGIRKVKPTPKQHKRVNALFNKLHKLNDRLPDSVSRRIRHVSSVKGGFYIDLQDPAEQKFVPFPFVKTAVSKLVAYICMVTL